MYGRGDRTYRNVSVRIDQSQSFPGRFGARLDLRCLKMEQVSDPMGRPWLRVGTPASEPNTAAHTGTSSPVCLTYRFRIVVPLSAAWGIFPPDASSPEPGLCAAQSR